MGERLVFPFFFPRISFFPFFLFFFFIPCVCFFRFFGIINFLARGQPRWQQRWRGGRELGGGGSD